MSYSAAFRMLACLGESLIGVRTCCPCALGSNTYIATITSVVIGPKLQNNIFQTDHQGVQKSCV
jgi:hypothetical protein